MYCPNCGKKMPDEAKFCYLCGASLEELQETAEVPEEPVKIVKGDTGLDRSQTVVVQVGKEKEGEKLAGDHCPICGTYVRLEDSFRCGQCGRSYLCLRHRHERLYMCEECAAEAGQKLPEETRVPTDVDTFGMATREAPPVGPDEVDAYGEMILVPEGEFIMCRDDAYEEGIPDWLREMKAEAVEEDVITPREVVRRAFTNGFYLAKYPMTNVRYAAFIEAGGYSNKEYWSVEGWGWREEERVTQPACWDEDDFNQPDQPVVGVSYYEAEAYCHWAGNRLPTEQEWEKAARGTNGREYPWGNEWQEGRCNSQELNVGHTTPVDRFRGGASPYGVMDMVGNIWEWTSSWVDAEHTEKVLRGGSWFGSQHLARCAARARERPGGRNSRIGFRCARSSAE